MKEWYLMEPYGPCLSASGLFTDALDTDAARTVIVFNSDLSERRSVRCILLGNTPDTQPKSAKRTGLFPIGAIKAGMYLFYDENFWLISGRPGNQGIYEKAAMVLCQYPLRWQNLQGTVTQRWCSCASADNYNKEEAGNSALTLASDTLTLLLPNDAETAGLTGKRVFIDSRSANPEKVYRITRMDDVLYDYGDAHGRVLRLIARLTERNETADRKDLRICDYIPPLPSPSEEISGKEAAPSAVINGSSVLKIGYGRRYTVKFADTEELKTRSLPVSWKILCDFSERIKQTAKGTVVRLQIDDEACIGRSFLLQALKDGTAVAELSVRVTGGF